MPFLLLFGLRKLSTSLEGGHFGQADQAGHCFYRFRWLFYFASKRFTVLNKRTNRYAKR